MSSRKWVNRECRSLDDSDGWFDKMNVKRQRLIDADRAAMSQPTPQMLESMLQAVVVPLSDRANARCATFAQLSPTLNSNDRMHMPPAARDNQQGIGSNIGINDSDKELFGESESGSNHWSSNSLFSSSSGASTDHQTTDEQTANSENDQQAVNSPDNQNVLSPNAARSAQIDFMADFYDETQEPWEFQSTAANEGGQDRAISRVTSFCDLRLTCSESTPKGSEESNIEDASEATDHQQALLSSATIFDQSSDGATSHGGLSIKSVELFSGDSTSASVTDATIICRSVSSGSIVDDDDDDDNDDGHNDDHHCENNSNNIDESNTGDDGDDERSNSPVSINEAESNEPENQLAKSDDVVNCTHVADQCEEDIEADDDAADGSVEAMSQRRVISARIRRGIGKNKLATALARQMRLADADRAMWAYEDAGSVPSHVVHIKSTSTQWGLHWTDVSDIENNDDKDQAQHRRPLAVLDSLPMTVRSKDSNSQAEHVALYEPIARVQCPQADVLLAPRYYCPVKNRPSTDQHNLLG